MLTKLKNRKQGFTIIEVLIVLAIAGLILLIVFLAVPALQRSARNTQRKNDGSQIASAFANFIANNNGTLPSLVFDNGTTNSISFTASATAGANSESAKLGFFTSKGSVTEANAAGQDGNIYISKAAATVVADTVVAPGSESATAVSTNTVSIVYGQDCTPTANPRTAAIYYATESGSGNGSLQCVEQ